MTIKTTESFLRSSGTFRPKSVLHRSFRRCAVFSRTAGILLSRGECHGVIGYEKRGDGGFGYDPLFYVGDRSFAEFSPEEKDAVSHRGNALRKLAKELPEYLK